MSHLIIEVQCPHCGNRGTIPMPPLGALIIGPCPNCREFVMIFCDYVIPLEKGVLLNAPAQEKHKYLLAKLCQCLSEKIEKVVEQIKPKDWEGGLKQFEEEIDEDWYTQDGPPDGMITSEELLDFKKRELRLIDNKEYFKTHFD